ncbi:MAG: hypothetical protein JRI96_17855 [Deltaproteobacteria bacterium]|nr:hypothetical protein [Deltaproteobacteria bacterium]
MLNETVKFNGRIPVLLFIICAVVSVASANDEEGLPYICVSGIMFDEDKSLAVINDRVIGKGDSVEGAKILRITNSYVQFVYKGEVFNREIGEGCRKTAQLVHKRVSRYKENNSVKSTGVDNRYVGLWVNEDADTPFITRVEIRDEFIHMWGKCHPTD